MKSGWILPSIVTSVLAVVSSALAQDTDRDTHDAAPAEAVSLGKVLVASNALKLSANRLREGGETKEKLFLVPFAGTVRVTWQARSLLAGSPASVGAVSKVAGCGGVTKTVTFKAGSCDLRVAVGDIVRVSAYGEMIPWSAPPTRSTVYIRNVRLSYTVVDATGRGEILKD